MARKINHPDIEGPLAALEAVGGASFTELAALLALYVDAGGEAVLPATKEEIWEEASGFLIITPQVMAESEDPVTITPVANVLTVDGHLGINFEGTVSDATNFGTPANLKWRPRRVSLTATGAGRAITATGFDRTTNFGAGITIPQNKWGTFLCYRDGSDNDVITFAGYSD